MKNRRLCCCEIFRVDTTCEERPIRCTRSTRETGPLLNGSMLFSKLLVCERHPIGRTVSWWGIHVDFETVFFAFAEDFDSVVHEFIVIFTTTFRSQHQQPFAIWFKYTTYGPS